VAFQIHNSGKLAQQDANNKHFHLNNSVMMDESHSEKILYKKKMNNDFQQVAVALPQRYNHL